MLLESIWCAFHILWTAEHILIAWGSPSSSSMLHLISRTKLSDLLKFLRWRIKREGFGWPAFASSNAMSSSHGTSQMILQGFVSILSGAKHYNKERSNEGNTKGLTEYLIEKNEPNRSSNEKSVKGGYLKIFNSIYYTCSSMTRLFVIRTIFW